MDRADVQGEGDSAGACAMSEEGTTVRLFLALAQVCIQLMLRFLQRMARTGN